MTEEQKKSYFQKHPELERLKKLMSSDPSNINKPNSRVLPEGKGTIEPHSPNVEFDKVKQGYQNQSPQAPYDDTKGPSKKFRRSDIPWKDIGHVEGTGEMYDQYQGFPETLIKGEREKYKKDIETVGPHRATNKLRDRQMDIKSNISYSNRYGGYAAVEPGMRDEDWKNLKPYQKWDEDQQEQLRERKQSPNYNKRSGYTREISKQPSTPTMSWGVRNDPYEEGK